MRVLLDEHLPVDLALEFAGHDVDTVVGRGWAGITNGDLLRRMSGDHDVLITMDRGIEFQQPIAGFPFGVVPLRGRGNRNGSLSLGEGEGVAAHAPLQRFARRRFQRQEAAGRPSEMRLEARISVFRGRRTGRGNGAGGGPGLGGTPGTRSADRGPIRMGGREPGNDEAERE